MDVIAIVPIEVDGTWYSAGEVIPGAEDWHNLSLYIANGQVAARTEQNAGTATFSGDGAVTTFSVAHGLSGTPTARSVWAESADAAGDKHVSNVDGTNIDVTFATAPGSGTDNVVIGFDARL